MAPALTDLTSLYLLLEIQSASSDSSIQHRGSVAYLLVSDPNDFQGKIAIFQLRSLPSLY